MKYTWNRNRGFIHTHMRVRFARTNKSSRFFFRFNLKLRLWICKCPLKCKLHTSHDGRTSRISKQTKCAWIWNHQHFALLSHFVYVGLCARARVLKYEVSVSSAIQPFLSSWFFVIHNPLFSPSSFINKAWPTSFSLSVLPFAKLFDTH